MPPQANIDPFRVLLMEENLGQCYACISITMGSDPEFIRRRISSINSIFNSTCLIGPLLRWTQCPWIFWINMWIRMMSLWSKIRCPQRLVVYRGLSKSFESLHDGFASLSLRVR